MEDEDDVYEEYRNRLLENNDILRLEIYETFAGTDFIINTVDLVELLQDGKDKDIIEELEEIKQNIFKVYTNKYTKLEKQGYLLITKGYILRLKSRCSNER